MTELSEPSVPGRINGREAVAAVDIGGTTIKGAVFTTSGILITRAVVPTFGESGEVYEEVARLIRLLRRQSCSSGYRLGAIGIATPGIVDPAVGNVLFAANLDWKGFPLRENLQDQFQVPVAVDHDARAGASAERSAGQVPGDYDDFLFVPIGTGVSSAVVTAGRPLLGSGGAAGEFGHMRVVPDGELCPCGQRGCVEAYASARSIAARYERAGGKQAMSARDVARMIGTDQIAATVWADAIDALAAGLSALTAVLDPSRIVIGGGLSQAGDVLIKPLTSSVARMLTWREAPTISCSILGTQAGLIGAALLAAPFITMSADFARSANKNVNAGDRRFKYPGITPSSAGC